MVSRGMVPSRERNGFSTSLWAVRSCDLSTGQAELGFYYPSGFEEAVASTAARRKSACDNALNPQFVHLYDPARRVRPGRVRIPNTFL